jgi:hypothetical protein
MSDAGFVGFPEAARRLGVTVGVLRRAIRGGRVPAPPVVSAIARLPEDWLAGVKAAAAADPGVFVGTRRQKVAAFARYEGTSAWRKYANRVREHAHFVAAHPAV